MRMNKGCRCVKQQYQKGAGMTGRNFHSVAHKLHDYCGMWTMKKRKASLLIHIQIQNDMNDVESEADP